MPLNEECGLLEWVVNTNALKNILEKGYQRHNKRIWVGPRCCVVEWQWLTGLAGRTATDAGECSEAGSSAANQALQRDGPSHVSQYLHCSAGEEAERLTRRQVRADSILRLVPRHLARAQCVASEQTGLLADPGRHVNDRLRARVGPSDFQDLMYRGSVLTVRSLGDRHGENILFDSLTGDTVHVDLNCLFDKVSRRTLFTHGRCQLIEGTRAKHSRFPKECRSD